MSESRSTARIAAFALAIIGAGATIHGSPPSLQAEPQLAATAHPRASPESLTIVLKEKFGRDDLVAIIRRTSDGTIVAVKRSELSAGLLMTVLAALPLPEPQVGSRPGAKVDMYFRTGTPLRPIVPQQRGVVDALVAQLRSAPSRQVAPAGNVPAITILASSVSGLTKGAGRARP